MLAPPLSVRVPRIPPGPSGPLPNPPNPLLPATTPSSCSLSPLLSLSPLPSSFPPFPRRSARAARRRPTHPVSLSRPPVAFSSLRGQPVSVAPAPPPRIPPRFPATSQPLCSPPRLHVGARFRFSHSPPPLPGRSRRHGRPPLPPRHPPRSAAPCTLAPGPVPRSRFPHPCRSFFLFLPPCSFLLPFPSASARVSGVPLSSPPSPPPTSHRATPRKKALMQSHPCRPDARRRA